MSALSRLFRTTVCPECDDSARDAGRGERLPNAPGRTVIWLVIVESLLRQSCFISLSGLSRGTGISSLLAGPSLVRDVNDDCANEVTVEDNGGLGVVGVSGSFLSRKASVVSKRGVGNGAEPLNFGDLGD